jgi:RNA polymerase sigma-70 factor, ECF subfamily
VRTFPLEEDGDVRASIDGDAAADRADRLLALVAEANGGDRASLKDLVAAIAPVMRRAVSSVLGRSAHEVDDVLQEALMAFVRALPAFRQESSVARYAYRIAVRIALPARRKGGRIDAGKKEYAQARETRAPRPSTDAVYRSRRRALLRALLDELPPAQAEAFAHRFLWGATVEEIATETGVPANTVRSRLHAARQALRRRIEADPSFLELVLGEP